MRLLADVNIPRRLVERLREAGHDTTWMLELGPRLSDVEICEVAAAEGRVIVSEDRDFGEITLRRRATIPGLVLLELHQLAFSAMVERAVEAIDAEGDHIPGNLLVVEPARVRWRKLPSP